MARSAVIWNANHAPALRVLIKHEPSGRFGKCARASDAIDIAIGKPAPTGLVSLGVFA